MKVTKEIFVKREDVERIVFNHLKLSGKGYLTYRLSPYGLVMVFEEEPRGA